jgi:hypothetical protein
VPGFRTDFGWINLPVFGEDGQPGRELGVVEGAFGLYFLGRFFLFALNSSADRRVVRDAEHIAQHVASQRMNGVARVPTDELKSPGIRLSAVVTTVPRCFTP